MSIGSFFKKVGVDLEKVLGVGVEVAEVAEPVVDVLFPAVGALYNSAVNEAVKLLAAGSAAAAQGGSATVQLENVAATLAPMLIAYAEGEGLPVPTATHVTAFTQAVLTSLQVLIAIETGARPAPTAPPVSAPVQVAPPAPVVPTVTAAPQVTLTPAPVAQPVILAAE